MSRRKTRRRPAHRRPRPVEMPASAAHLRTIRAGGREILDELAASPDELALAENIGALIRELPPAAAASVIYAAVVDCIWPAQTTESE